MNLKSILAVGGVMVLMAVMYFLFSSKENVSAVQTIGDAKGHKSEMKVWTVAAERNKRTRVVADAGSEGVEDSSSQGEDADVPLTEDEKCEAAETALVDEFDSLTDKWMDPVKDGVSMKSVTEFVEKFRKLPKSRKEECLQRALNLVPDENVMLLAGILMDKTMEKDYIELVFNDILNRDESVKKPIMRQIFKDRTHPCWADTAWILDVTGELPKDK
ncbi:MAG: hypothetical protein IKJ45_08020 [Kiritimatiellae bacterium]|nr:hypothetical protein [Kiritimatiellia bacterium]